VTAPVIIGREEWVVTDLEATAGDDRPVQCPVDSEASKPLPVLRELTRLLLAAGTVDGVLRGVITTARHAIPGADLVSITLRHDDGRLETPAGTGPAAVDLDQAQYRAGKGPCVDVADPAGPAYIINNDLSGETAWPVFAASATVHGFVSVLSTALLSGTEPVPFTGALNIYSRDRHRFDDTARDFAFLLATHASLAVATASRRQALADADNTVVNLRRALQSRTIIGQATGILMARRNLTAHEAFDVLNRVSQNRNIKLVHLAALLTDQADIADRL
jgi:transcriptional regulator with GAF, ATPase, and Fis domain